MPRLRSERPIAAAGVRSRVALLRLAAIPILQAGAAAGIAWFAAHDLVGHARPFFAPIAAVIALGTTPGRRLRGTVEMVLGVALGILVGDFLIEQAGTGALQLGLVVMLAMVTAVVVGGSAVLVAQSATSGILIAALGSTSSGLRNPRMVDALVGGAIGLAVLAAVPRNPLRMVERATTPVLAELAAALDEAARALAQVDGAAARAALARVRALDDALRTLHEAVGYAAETSRLAPAWWRTRDRMAAYAAAAVQIDHAVRNGRVLIRGVIRAVDLKPAVPPEIAEAIAALAHGVRVTAAELAAERPADTAYEAVLAAVAIAASALESDSGLSVSVLVGQVRSLAADLLRALGVGDEEAMRHVRRAAGVGW